MPTDASAAIQRLREGLQQPQMHIDVMRADLIAVLNTLDAATQENERLRAALGWTAGKDG